MPPITLLVAGDLHYQSSNRGSLYCSRALELWAHFLEQTGPLRPAAILQAGDLIDGYKLPLEVCRRDLVAVRDALAQSPIEVHPIIGNHESIYLPDRPFMLQALGWSGFSRVVEVGPLRVILFDLTVDGASYGLFTPERKAWLQAQLESEPERPVILLQHPLIHPHEEVCGHRHYVRNSGDYLCFLLQFPQLRMILTGHRHIPGALALSGSAAAPAHGAQRHPLWQITLPAFCSWPFTFGKLTMDPEKRSLAFREMPLEPSQGAWDAEAMASLLEEGRQLRIGEHPEVWSERARLTPELAELIVTW